MAEQIKATKREKAGKGASRAIRLQGSIPAVIYGDKKAPEMISVEEKVLVAEMGKKGLWTRQYEIEVDGKKNLVLCQDIQKHPVSNRPIHADFLRISKDSVLTMDIPLHFVGEDVCPGIKKGGVLNIVHRTLEVKCKADAIPEEFIVDLSQGEIGSSFEAFAIQLPAGVKLTAQQDFTVATIVTPQEEVKEEAPAATAAPAADAAAAPEAGAEAAAPAAEEKKEEKK
ncbi:MAG: 50S ribosomal protein L25/general stress protein Ctc [Alphaproteobacteria bacterium]|nr:50S ribosomal protein L25/general stress protein Ctc [Alphaproteobacteria bacterium]